MWSCERDLGATPRTRYFLVELPATVSLTRCVQFAHQRWANEQQYQELKTELGLDHFEGPTPSYMRALVQEIFTA